MAYLQTTCVIGTLAISASNSNALGSIIISDTMSPGPEFNGNCNLIAIGQNTSLTGSGGLDISTIVMTQDGSGFCPAYNYYQIYNGSSKPVVLTGGGSGTGAAVSANVCRYTSYYFNNNNPGNEVYCGDVNNVSIDNPGSGYTSTVTGVVSDPCKTNEVCAIFTVDPLSNQNSINIGHNAGCRSQGKNTIRIGESAGRGNLENSYCFHTDSIAIGTNTMLSGSFISSIAIGEAALKGNNICTNFNRCIVDNVVIGKYSLCNFKSSTQKNVVVGNCNVVNGCYSQCNYIIGWCNGTYACNLNRVNVIIGTLNSTACGSNKNYGINNIAIGAFNFKTQMCSSTNNAIGYANMCAGIVSSANNNQALGAFNMRSLTTGDCNIAIGYQNGDCTTTGCLNVYMGLYAGCKNCTGGRSIYIGCAAGCGMINQNDSIFIGPGVSRYGSSEQGGHIVMGVDALRNMCAGYFNTVIGYGAMCVGGQNSSTCAINGGCNIAIGPYAGQCIKGASNNNIYIGQRSGPTFFTAETYKFYLGQGQGNHLMCGCLNATGKSLTISGSIDFGDYTSTSVTTTSALNPNQNNQAPTYDTLATLAVDPSGNVVRGDQEGTWTFTRAQLQATLGQTLISAPGSGKAIIIHQVDWMVKYTGTSTGSTSQRLELRQATQTSTVGTIAVFPGQQINEITNFSGDTSGFYSRDTPSGQVDARYYKNNTATTIAKTTSGNFPSGLTSISIKIKYRLYDVNTF